MGHLNQWIVEWKNVKYGWAEAKHQEFPIKITWVSVKWTKTRHINTMLYPTYWLISVAGFCAAIQIVSTPSCTSKHTRELQTFTQLLYQHWPNVCDISPVLMQGLPSVSCLFILPCCLLLEWTSFLPYLGPCRPQWKCIVWLFSLR